MSERHPHHDFSEDQLGVESFVPEQPIPEGMTPKQYDRLQRFEHLLTTANKFAGQLDQGRTIHWGRINGQGKVYDTYFTIDRAMIGRLRRLAYGMYEGEFRDQPLLDDIALDIAGTTRAEAAPLTPQQLSALWARE